MPKVIYWDKYGISPVYAAYILAGMGREEY
jgi:hypothetical protein